METRFFGFGSKAQTLPVGPTNKLQKGVVTRMCADIVDHIPFLNIFDKRLLHVWFIRTQKEFLRRQAVDFPPERSCNCLHRDISLGKAHNADIGGLQSSQMVFDTAGKRRTQFC